MKYHCKTHDETFDTLLEAATHAKSYAVMSTGSRFKRAARAFPKPICEITNVGEPGAHFLDEVKALLGAKKTKQVLDAAKTPA